ncbi:MAG: electron transport complex subunit E [Fibrobacterales bacterium]
MNLLNVFRRGFTTENPVFVLLLGMCPALGVTSSAINGLGMGLASTAVLVGSNFVISIIKNFIPDKVRIPAFIVIIASFVTVIDLLMAAHLPDLHEQLGLFIPLIVVNCLILGRAEAFASKNSMFPAVIDGLGMGLGFAFALTLLGAVREVLGAGSIFDYKFVSADATTMLLFILPPGAFIALGFLTAAFNKFARKS